MNINEFWVFLQQPALYSAWALIGFAVVSYPVAYGLARGGSGTSTIAEHASKVLRAHVILLCLAAVLAASCFWWLHSTNANALFYAILTVHAVAVLASLYAIIPAFRRQ